jgi:hypothetical protein
MKRSETEICIALLACFFFLNAGDVCALKKYATRSYFISKNDSLSRFFDIKSFGIKYNNQDQSHDQITLSQFYQNGYDGTSTGWNVRSLGVVVHSKFDRFNFNVDQGILTDPNDNIAPTKLAHRFGLSLEQDYLDGDRMNFGIYCGTRKPFPEFSFYGSYSHNISRLCRFQGEVYAMILEDDGAYLFMASSFTKAFQNHYLTAKPYCLMSQNIRAGFILSDQIFFRRNANYMVFKLVSGYYPDSYAFINYESVNNRRYRISCEGLFDIPKCQLSIIPLIGYEYVQDSMESYPGNWHAQIGLRYTFKNKDYYAENRHSAY